MKKIVFFVAVCMFPLAEGWAMDSSSEDESVSPRSYAKIYYVAYDSKAQEAFINEDQCPSRNKNSIGFSCGNQYIFPASNHHRTVQALPNFLTLALEEKISNFAKPLVVEPKYNTYLWEAHPVTYLKPGHKYGVTIVKKGDKFTALIVDDGLIY